ncbi:MAG: hypothetical protein WC676_02980 [Candidatus Omnitrophota bacterium]
MKEIISKYCRIENMILAFLILIIAGNALSLFKNYQKSAQTKGIIQFTEPGFEFARFKKYLKNERIIGFLTDKDMSSERNDGQFLSAQFALAPTVLDLNGLSHQFFIIDATNLVNASEMTKKLNLNPLHVNEHEKILAEKNP